MKYDIFCCFYSFPLTVSGDSFRQVMQSLRFALQPAVQDISVSWHLPKGVSANVVSTPLTSIFQGQRSLIYAQLIGQVRAPIDRQQREERERHGF